MDRRAMDPHNTALRATPNCVSLKSGDSKHIFMDFKKCLSVMSNDSKDFYIDFKDIIWDEDHRPNQKSSVQLQDVFKRLEESVYMFVKNELEKFFIILSTEHLDCTVFMKDQDQEQQRSSEAFLKITLLILRNLQQDDLATILHEKIHYTGVCRHKLKSSLQRKFRCTYEGVPKPGSPSLLNHIYTDLHVTEGGAPCPDVAVGSDVAVGPEEAIGPEAAISLKAVISMQDVFSGSFRCREPIRTVLTKGVAGVGKTLLTQKFILDWAEGTNQDLDLQLLFPFTFRELNVLRETELSLTGLVHHFFSETKKTRLRSFNNLRVLFVLDGLEESQVPMNFSRTRAVTDTAESVPLDVLLVNLIRGNLLPSAYVWITSRPAAAAHIPAECVSLVIEVRGFSNLQREHYFRKRFRDEADAIISHIRSSRSLYTMCYLPVFCWILSTVLLHILKTGTIQDLPQTLTEMFIHFLVVQTKLRSKYDGSDQTDPQWSRDTKRMVQGLGQLAFEQLRRGNLFFYESDLRHCGVDAAAASVYSGVFTQVFKEEAGLYRDKLYCFIHRTVQEFLAALHVHQTFICTGLNLLAEKQSSLRSKLFSVSSSDKFYQAAVDQMLENPDLDVFVRFLQGLSLPSNQNLLRGLVKRTSSSNRGPQKTAEYVTLRLEQKLSADKSGSLFHCLTELKDRRLVEQMQQLLSSKRPIREELSVAQWNALVFILLSSDQREVFELKKICASEEALLHLLPVVRTYSTALLSSCDLTLRSCEALCAMFSSPLSVLTNLDLSFNELQDPGTKILALALRSPHCRVQTLRLAGCQISEEGCLSLATALASRPSLITDLDLSYNHPGPSGAKQLCALQGAPHSRLRTLRLKPSGAQWLRPLIKYFTPLTLDVTSAYRFLRVSEDLQGAAHVQRDQGNLEHPLRFNSCPQLLCSSVLSGRSYWEVDWSGSVLVSVCYRGMNRKGNSTACGFGLGPQSWSLSCSRGTYAVSHGGRMTTLPYSSPGSGRAAVYVDVLGGRLSFYAVCEKEQLLHLHSFSSTFTEPIVPGFQLLFGSSIRLRNLLQEE